MINNLFPTPIYVTDLPSNVIENVQSEFDTVYNEYKLKNEFGKQEGWKGTHLLSDPTFKSSFIKEYNLLYFQNVLKDHVTVYLKSIKYGGKIDYDIPGSWMTLSRKNEYAYTHTHGSYDISGVYYYKTNSSDGDIYFRTPNPLPYATYCYSGLTTDVYYKPVVGRLILFPSWLNHGTIPNTTDNERVSVSFNLRFTKK